MISDPIPPSSARLPPARAIRLMSGLLLCLSSLAFAQEHTPSTTSPSHPTTAPSSTHPESDRNLRERRLEGLNRILRQNFQDRSDRSTPNDRNPSEGRPDDRRSDDRRPEDRPLPPSPGGGGGALSRETITREERDEVLQFIRTHMPNTANYWEETLGNPEFRTRRAWVFSHALFQYRRYNKTRNDLPDLEDRLIEDVRITDQILGLAIQHTRASSERERVELRTQIREKLNLLAQGVLTERKRRIERLREQLEREEANLAREEKVIEDNIDLRVDEMINRITYGTRYPVPPGNDPSPPRP